MLHLKRFAAVCGAVCLLSLTFGCTNTSEGPALKLVADIAPYNTVYMEKVTVASGVAIKTQDGTDIQDTVLATATSKIAAGINKATTTQPSSGNFLRLSAVITQYEPGNDLAKHLLLGTTTIKIDVTAYDATTGKPVATGQTTDIQKTHTFLLSVFFPNRSPDHMLDDACKHIATEVNAKLVAKPQ